MNMDLGITMYDVIIIGLFLLFIGRGVWVGFLRQITVLLALYLGYFSAGRYHDTLFPFLADISENPGVGFWVTYVILFFVSYLVVMLIGKGLIHVVEVSIAAWFDRVLGAVLGGAKAAIIVILLHMILGAFLSPESDMLKKCVSCDTLNKATDCTLEFIGNEKVRKSFLQGRGDISAEEIREFLVTPSQEESAPVQ